MFFGFCAIKMGLLPILRCFSPFPFSYKLSRFAHRVIKATLKIAVPRPNYLHFPFIPLGTDTLDFISHFPYSGKLLSFSKTFFNVHQRLFSQAAAQNFSAFADYRFDYVSWIFVH